MFFRYPHTPHLAWLAPGLPREDKVLSDIERAEFLSHSLIVEEKVDGANVGFSVAENGELRIQNRGSFLDRATAAPQFKPLFRWADSRRHTLLAHLKNGLIQIGRAHV